MELGNNIRDLRKKRGMTQEQLAQAMGVTVGAVYKWEAEKCVPDIAIIMELADLFGVSVDVLLSYHLRENGRKESVERLKRLRREKAGDAALAEAEKALVRYPNSFDIVYESAELYAAVGVERKEQRQIRRAVEADILNWQIGSYQGLKTPGKASFLDKNEAMFEATSALMWIRQGELGAALDHLRRAKAAAQRFDAAPDYHGKGIRFFESEEPMTMYDDMGATAMEAIEKHVAEEACEELRAMWEEVKAES